LTLIPIESPPLEKSLTIWDSLIFVIMPPQLARTCLQVDKTFFEEVFQVGENICRFRARARLTSPSRSLNLRVHRGQHKHKKHKGCFTFHFEIASPLYIRMK
jgi:hypothetical protein